VLRGRGSGRRTRWRARTRPARWGARDVPSSIEEPRCLRDAGMITNSDEAIAERARRFGSMARATRCIPADRYNPASTTSGGRSCGADCPPLDRLAQGPAAKPDALRAGRASGDSSTPVIARPTAASPEWHLLSRRPNKVDRRGSRDQGCRTSDARPNTAPRSTAGAR